MRMDRIDRIEVRISSLRQNFPTGLGSNRKTGTWVRLHVGTDERTLLEASSKL